MKLVLGMGCDRNTPLETLERAVALALQEAGGTLADVQRLATIEAKRDELALCQLAQKWGWPLDLHSAEALAAVKVPNPSPVVLKYMGTPAVAEAAALLSGGNPGWAALLVEKRKHRGTDGKNATVSVVRMAT
ncbi:cobalamin (vitamin B12) biosynthesis CbiG protein [Magnetococcus marinus MC-1]|uniref:Cobalamin (Vitamin B12) biosynthesis CbiG protein n=1 Tax=Magnetococcus marinus (strain ATCC BAA-1437 / JCM 17883 / MC-1) TaxID=156889 RepID=A0LCC6_MAGMM|nr:cobalamin biosynthesis protein [Magnetococcus marinus]ABK45619.1 cobalamin (vitamin B12) biosynthesis CbiG protein [Magnetococcus marinus MC-1]